MFTIPNRGKIITIHIGEFTLKKCIGKKVKFVISDNSFTGFDINNSQDLEILNLVFDYIKKKKIKKIIY